MREGGEEGDGWGTTLEERGGMLKTVARVHHEWKSSSSSVAPPTASILLWRGADALPDPQACLLLLFTAVDMFAAHR